MNRRATKMALMFGLSIALLTGIASAKPKGATPPKDPAQKKENPGVVGTVLKTDGANIVLQTHGKNSAEVTVVTDAKTQFELKGAAAKFADIKPGMQVVVTPPTGTAQKVVVAEQVKTKKDKKKKKDA